jgi:hypothetical protein
MTNPFTLINAYLSSEWGKNTYERAWDIPTPGNLSDVDYLPVWGPGFYTSEDETHFIVVYTPFEGETHNPDGTPTEWSPTLPSVLDESKEERTVSFGFLNPYETKDLVAAYQVEGSVWKRLKMPESFRIEDENSLQQMIAAYSAQSGLTTGNTRAMSDVTGTLDEVGV